MNIPLLAVLSALLSVLVLSGCSTIPPGSPAGVVSPTPVYMQPNHYNAPRGYWTK